MPLPKHFKFWLKMKEIYNINLKNNNLKKLVLFIERIKIFFLEYLGKIDFYKLFWRIQFNTEQKYKFYGWNDFSLFYERNKINNLHLVFYNFKI